MPPPPSDPACRKPGPAGKTAAPAGNRRGQARPGWLPSRLPMPMGQLARYGRFDLVRAGRVHGRIVDRPRRRPDASHLSHTNPFSAVDHGSEPARCSIEPVPCGPMFHRAGAGGRACVCAPADPGWYARSQCLTHFSRLSPGGRGSQPHPRSIAVVPLLAPWEKCAICRDLFPRSGPRHGTRCTRDTAPTHPRGTRDVSASPA